MCCILCVLAVTSFNWTPPLTEQLNSTQFDVIWQTLSDYITAWNDGLDNRLTIANQTQPIILIIFLTNIN